MEQLWLSEQGEQPEYAFQLGERVHLLHPNDVGMEAQEVTIVNYWRNNQWTIREDEHNTTVAVDAEYLTRNGG